MTLQNVADFNRARIQRASQVQAAPEPHGEAEPLQHVMQIVNGVFSKLGAMFPASLSNRSQSELDEIRRQWVLAFRENGITSKHQVLVGLRVARQQERPFFPSPGQFIAWCRSGESNAAGLPDADELYRMLMKYCAERSLYNSPEEYPWPSNAAYWMVTRLYDAMRSQGLTESETRKRCVTELNDMASRIQAGEEIPKPVKQIPKLYIPVPKEVGIARIAEIKRKYFRGRT
ncbi:Replication protein P [Plesiomonas shigelloides]|nr:Replication protein P [Plesiomonas shigelloides]